MREKFLLFLIPLIALMAGAAHFQTSESSTENRSKTDSSIPAEEKPFWESAQKFLDAYTARDAKALGMMFTDDAEFRDEFGERTVGREAITALFADVFENSPEAILEAIDIERIRYIDKHVALEEGWVSARDTADGPLHFSRYVALHTLGEDGVWRINTLKDYPARSSRQERTPRSTGMVGGRLDQRRRRLGRQDILQMVRRWKLPVTPIRSSYSQRQRNGWCATNWLGSPTSSDTLVEFRFGRWISHRILDSE